MGENNTTPQDWMHADLHLGLGADILPIVPAGTPASPYSKVKKFGKTPSDYGPHGARGLTGWQSRTIAPTDIDAWAREPRYSICVRAAAVRAIDVDVTDAPRAAAILKVLSPTLMQSSVRRRSNSSKFLIPFKLAAPLGKRIIDVGDKQRIELLADGQQWLMCGIHESGVRYEWNGGDRLPAEIPTITIEQLEALWSKLVTEFAVSTPLPEQPKGPADAATSPDVLTAISPESLLELKDALAYQPLRDAADDNSFWSEIGYSLLSLRPLGFELGFELWSEFERGGTGHENTAGDWWRSHASQTPKSDYRHIFTLARRLGWGKQGAPIEMFKEYPAEKPSDASTAELLAPAPDRPIIKLIASQLHEHVDQAMRLLDVYVQGTHLVRFGSRNLVDEVRDPKARPLVAATSAFMQVELTRVATIMKYDGRVKDWIKIDCPSKFAEILGNLKHWIGVKELNAVALAPFMRLDGSICSKPGYDAASGVMYAPSIEFPPLIAQPTRDDALAALELLRAPFNEFPINSEAGRSAFIAHILTEATRTAMPTSPMFWYTASTAGTGKTLLAEMPSQIVYGMMPATRPWVEGDEMRKALYASLLAGDRSIRFDNLTNGGKFRGPLLCSFLTSPLYSDRKLGESRAEGIPNLTVVSATGNNITPSGEDLVRRSLVIRMDANMDQSQLKARRFRIEDLRGYVHENRAALLNAALTIVHAHRISGLYHSPSSLLPSFEAWSRLVRGALLWLGQADPLETQTEDSTEDEGDYLANAFEFLAVRYGDKPFEARNVVEAGHTIVDRDGVLSASLLGSGCANPLDVIKVGYWLRSNRDKVAGGYKLRGDKSPRGPVLWRLVMVDL